MSERLQGKSAEERLRGFDSIPNASDPELEQYSGDMITLIIRQASDVARLQERASWEPVEAERERVGVKAEEINAEMDENLSLLIQATAELARRAQSSLHVVAARRTD